MSGWSSQIVSLHRLALVNVRIHGGNVEAADRTMKAVQGCVWLCQWRWKESGGHDITSARKPQRESVTSKPFGVHQNQFNKDLN